MGGKKYFVSYTGCDEAWAEWIAGVLEEHGQTALIQAWDIHAGDNFILKMHEFLRECDVCIPVLSQEYLESAYCNEEWASAFGAAVKKGKKLIPVRIRNVEPDGLLYARVYCDLHNIHDEKVAEEKLLVDLVLTEKPRKKPAFPNTPAKPRKLFPGSLPPSNLPERNKYFLEHGKKFDEIRTHFKPGGAVCLKQAITGLGGIGKTQTAIEYAHRSMSDYRDAIWFVHAEFKETAFDDCLGFAETFGLIPEGMDEARKLSPEDLGKRLKDWFAAHDAWLFIFDNVEQSEVIAPYVSGVRTGHVLITTRHSQLSGQMESVDIEAFAPDEAVRFMRARLKKSPHLIDSKSVLNKLTKRLSCFPLALEQAAAYIEKAQISCSEYLDLLGEDKAEDAFQQEIAKPTTDYPHTVTKTLALSFDRLSESARQLFNLFTYMSPDKIPLDFFERQREKLPSPLCEDLANPHRRNEIVAEMLDYSLIKKDRIFCNIHRLVQEIGRGQIKDSETDWLNVCMEAVIEELPGEDGYGDREQRERFERIAVHASVIAGYAEKAYVGNDDKEEETARLYHLLGIGSRRLAQYGQALEWNQKALAICEKILGKEHPSTAATYNNIAEVCSDQGDYAKALEWHQKALDIREKVLGKEHRDTAVTYNNIAVLFDKQGDYAKALEWYQKALVIKEKVLCKEHPSTATTYNNIAVLFDKQGDYAKALEWYQKALVIKEKVLCKEHPSTATTYNNIALVFDKQGDYAKALEWYQKAFRIFLQRLGEAHPNTKIAKGSMEIAYFGTDFDEPFEQWFQRTFDA